MGSSPGTPRSERERIDGELRRAIDAGVPCSVCNDEYQLITGYDNTGFYSVGPYPNLLPRRLTFSTWEEWGDSIYAYFFVHEKAEPAERAGLVRESLEFAIDVFRAPADFNLDGYAVGPAAYDLWLAASDEDAVSFGSDWNARVWGECRDYAARYLEEVAEWFPSTAPAANGLARSYREVSQNLLSLTDGELSVTGRRQILEETKALEMATAASLPSALDALPAGTMGSGGSPRRAPEPASAAPPLLAEIGVGH